MLWELCTSLRTACPDTLRRLGYRYAAVACLARARRCAKAWAAHQANTQAAICAAIAAAEHGDTVLVLGSGPCLDLPIAELCARFSRLILADAAHPPAARRLARRHPGIELATLDLSGTAAGLNDATARQPPVPQCTAFLDLPRLGLVISANLLSQLPLLPSECCARRWPDWPAEAFSRAIIEAHLAHLRAFDCPVLLISDCDRTSFDRHGKPSSHDDPLFGIALPAGIEWDWHIAPPGEQADGHSAVNRVRAVRLK